MRTKLTVLVLFLAVFLSFSAQAACNTGNRIEMSVPTGYRGVDCTYNVYVNGTAVCSGKTGGASKITIPDLGNCTYKVVYGETLKTDCSTSKNSTCPNSAKGGANVTSKAWKYCYTAKPTVKPTAKQTVKPTAKPTSKPTAIATTKPTAVVTAKPTVKPTAAPTAKPTQAPVTGNNSSSLANQVVALVNEYRAQYGLSPVRVDSDLTSAACVRGKEIVDTFSHTRPNGSSWSTVSSKARGENIAKGYQTAEKVMAAWMTSEGHRANILRENFTTIGVCAYESNGVMHWVQLFGTN